MAENNKTVILQPPKTVVTYSFVIGGFDKDMEKKKTGEGYISDEFLVTGFPISIAVFPAGRIEDQKGFVSMYLQNRGNKDIAVMFEWQVGTFKGPKVEDVLKVRTFKGKGKFMTHAECKKQLKDGVFEVKVNIEVEGVKVKVPGGNPSLTQKRKSGVQEMVETMYSKMQKSDFTLVFDGKSVQCHKCVLMASSPVFEAMIETANMKESLKDTADLKFSAEVGESFVKSLYTDEIDEEVFVREVVTFLQLGEMYNLENLKIKAENKMIELLVKENMVEFLLASELHR